MEDAPKWWTVISEVENREIAPRDVIAEKRRMAAEYIENDVVRFQKKKGKSQDERWLKDISHKGTLSDKVSALAIMIQMDPLPNLEALRKLLAMAAKKGRREAQLAVDTLRTLFENTLLPDRKLRTFEQYPVHDPSTTSRHLKYWLFESELKKCYEQYCQALQLIANDSLPQMRRHALSTVYFLLKSKPENEQLLLSMLINKIGDNDGKTGSSAVHLILLLMNAHPNMKPIVVREIKQLIGRSLLDSKAVYYSVVALNQIFIDSPSLAEELIKIYLSLFQDREKPLERLLPQLLTGLSRALPYAERTSVDILKNHIDKLFKTIHSSSFSSALQAVSLLHEVVKLDPELEERYFRALYSLLDNDALRTSLKLTNFFNTVYKTLKSDNSLPRLSAFLHKLLQVSIHSSPGFICCVLFMCSEILDCHPELLPLFRSSQVKLVSQTEDAKSWKYDPSIRNPEFTHSEVYPFYELNVLVQHYHPSVKNYAELLLTNKPVECSNDPLSDYTITRFLDKFMYKNIKTKDLSHVRSHSKKAKQHDILVNSKEFLQLSKKKILPEDQFFRKFFEIRAKKEKQKQKEKKKTMGDEDEEAFADKIIQSKMHEDTPPDIDEDMEFSSSEEEGGGGAEKGDDEEEDDADESLFEEMGIEGGSGDEDEDEDEDEAEAEAAPRKKGEGKKSLYGRISGLTLPLRYMDADDFAEMLEQSGQTDKSKEQRKWEQRMENMEYDGKKRRQHSGAERPAKKRR